MRKEQDNLFSWVTHLKSNHASTKYISEEPTKVPTNLSTNDDKKSIIFTKYFKGNLMPFHRPHGLVFKKNIKRRPSNIIEPTMATAKTECSCCSQGCCSSTRHHRHSTTSLVLDDNLDHDQSIHPKDGMQSPASRMDGNSSLKNSSASDRRTSNTTQTSKDTTKTSAGSIRRTSRESSIIILPENLDSPVTGYKKIKEDGDLVDYDDISELDETEYSENVELRSVICNSLICLALNGPFQSPIQTDQKKQVLQVGCGGGDWCVDIAKSFPKWLVVGIDDKSGGPIQDHRKVPKNFKYILCYYDLLQTLVDMPSDSFDLVYCRFLIFIYNDDKYEELINECHRICKPGGFVEFYELDLRIYGNPTPGPMTYKFNSKVMRDMEQQNLNPHLARKLGDMVSSVFNKPSQEPHNTDTTDIRNHKKEHFNSNYTSLPLGFWGGRLGVMFRDDINEIFSSFEEPNDQEIETMNKEMEARKSFMNLHHVYAQKNQIENLAD